MEAVAEPLGHFCEGSHRLANVTDQVIWRWSQSVPGSGLCNVCYCHCPAREWPWHRNLAFVWKGNLGHTGGNCVYKRNSIPPTPSVPAAMARAEGPRVAPAFLTFVPVPGRVGSWLLSTGLLTTCVASFTEEGPLSSANKTTPKGHMACGVNSTGLPEQVVWDLVPSPAGRRLEDTNDGQDTEQEFFLRANRCHCWKTKLTLGKLVEGVISMFGEPVCPVAVLHHSTHPAQGPSPQPKCCLGGCPGLQLYHPTQTPTLVFSSQDTNLFFLFWMEDKWIHHINTSCLRRC